MKCDTLLGAFDKHNQEFAKRTGKDRSQNTLDKYLTVRKHLADFIKSQYRRSDIHMKEITPDFIKNFSLYLTLTLGLAPSSARLYCIPLKMLVTKAHNNGIIPTNPFAYYHVPQEMKERGYLTEDELRILMNHKLNNPRLEIVRDVFVFASLTGLSYIDIKNLTADKIATMTDGSKWIISSRKKTQNPYSVKLLDIPLQIIGKYISSNAESVFPIPRNSVCNLRQKEIDKECKIDKHLVFHMSRHSFATLALTKGVSLESVRKILGHTKITTTQIYAKITNEKIGRDMDLLSAGLGKLKME